MDKGFVWVIFIWLIAMIVIYSWKWRRERKGKIKYIDILKSFKKERRLR